MFSPETVAYVTKKVNESLVRKSPFPGSQRKKVESALSQARQRLEHIKEAIAQGIITPTTKAMLQETEERVAELEAALQAPAKPAVAALPVTVKRYLRELKQVLNRDNTRARHILATLIGEVILHRHGDRIVADFPRQFAGDSGPFLRFEWCRERDLNPHVWPPVCATAVIGLAEEGLARKAFDKSVGRGRTRTCDNSCKRKVYQRFVLRCARQEERNAKTLESCDRRDLRRWTQRRGSYGIDA